jgi:jacalin-like lectin domain-containing protein
MKQRLLIAGLISIVVTLCGSGWAVAQQAPSTEVVGGPGGNAFSDPEPAQGTLVVEVQVRSGDHVDSVQLVYMLSDGRIVMGPQHGGSGGGLSVFHLDADEYLIGISGRSGSYIDSIRFQTNKRTSPTFGGSGGSRDFRVDVPANAQLTGLAGRAGNYLDAIGLTFIPIRRGFYSGFGSAPQPGQTSLTGGSGGTVFVDGDVPAGASIVEVRVWAGDYVDSVQMIYNLPNGRSLEAVRHGGDGGRAASFRLEQGEYIVGLSGRCGTYVDSLRIHTNTRTSQLFGGSGGDRDLQIDVPDGNQATGFVGRSGTYLDAIGLTYARTPPPQDRFRERRRNR